MSIEIKHEAVKAISVEEGSFFYDFLKESIDDYDGKTAEVSVEKLAREAALYSLYSEDEDRAVYEKVVEAVDQLSSGEKFEIALI